MLWPLSECWTSIPSLFMNSIYCNCPSLFSSYLFHSRSNWLSLIWKQKLSRTRRSSSLDITPSPFLSNMRKACVTVPHWSLTWISKKQIHKHWFVSQTNCIAFSRNSFSTCSAGKGFGDLVLLNLQQKQKLRFLANADYVWLAVIQYLQLLKLLPMIWCEPGVALHTLQNSKPTQELEVWQLSVSVQVNLQTYKTQTIMIWERDWYRPTYNKHKQPKQT